MRALQGQEDSDEEKKSNKTDPTTKASSSINPPIEAEQRRGLTKVSSGLNIGINYLEAQEGQLHLKEQKFKQQMAPE